ncbi:MAG: hypothetical protein IMW86_04595 [Hydrogenibacillus sp.]|nr:hypothetical protein [Hydrogenibacillus sp.]
MDLFEVRDWTGEGAEDLGISGPLGATYSELKIIGYDPSAKTWVLWLRAHVPSIVRRDAEGRSELMATTKGSLPLQVYIYRWAGSGFESVDVAHAMKADYAVMDRDTGLIQVGQHKNDGQNDGPAPGQKYRYEDGKLVPIAGAYPPAGAGAFWPDRQVPDCG